MTSNQIRNILIAVDRSGYKDKIVAFASMLAKAMDSEIIAIHVIDKHSLGLGAVGDMLGYYRGGRVEPYEEAVQRKAKELLDEIKAACERENLKVQTEVISGSSIADSIIGYAKDNDIDVIIIGTLGMTGMEKFLLGSVASNVISHAHCPVVAVR